MRGKNFAIVILVMALASASAAYAKKDPKPAPPPPPPPGATLGSTLCTLGDITVGAGGSASACKGWYDGNLNGGSGDMKADSAIALNALLGVNTYTQANVTWLADLENLSGPTINFTQPLYGETIVSFHVGGAGGAGGVGYQSTAFYEFDAGDLIGGLDTFTFNLPGLSNARLYSTGSYVPPPPCTLDCGPPPCTENCGPPPCTVNCGPPPCTGICGGGGHETVVPEPAAWALMIAGFGGVGAMLRRRRAVLA
jgi:hypothetical protein